ncbi:MAG: hypothetical protein K6F53_12500 [Lachnospiraceae bacterium]|nr:hypothetical protein [Lachnospiraceae bacterium]
MIFESSKLKLEEVSTVRITPVNDCLICKDLKTNGAVMYTVLRVRDHEMVRNLLTMYEALESNDNPLLDSYSAEGDHIFIFPYRKERPLDLFYMGDTMPLQQSEDICINVILTCMTSGLPWPLLYLALRQGLLNLNRDDSVYLTYTIDLSELNPEIREKDCVVECARILMTLLESKAAQKADSYLLLQKKSANQSYSFFTELYRDVRLASAPKRKKGLWHRFLRFLAARSDFFFGILFWICLILAIVAIAMFLTNIAFGDIPWLRLFFNSFKKIGTEVLTK